MVWWWQRGAGTKEAGGTASPAPVQAPEAQPAHRSKQQALDACREQHGKLIRCLTSASWSSFNGAWFCAPENKEFWACYEKERGGIKWKPGILLNDMMLVPEGLKRQNEAQKTENAVPEKS